MNSTAIALIVVALIVMTYVVYTHIVPDLRASSKPEQMSASRHQESDAEGLSAME